MAKATATTAMETRSGRPEILLT